MLMKTKIFTKSVYLMPSRSTVAVQREHGSPWTHVTIVGHGSEDHNGRFYKISVIKWDISSQEQTTHEAHSIWAEDYLHKTLCKRDTPQVNNRLNELIDSHARLYSNKELVGLDMCNSKTDNEWGKQTMTSIPKHTGKEQSISRDLHLK